ncbi:TPA: ABC-three component system protein [Streptococcus suis]
MKVDRRNAVSSWSGYNHQGKVGIFLAIRELKKLTDAREDCSKYKLIFEKNGGEDVDICCSTAVVSRHQVKAKKDGKYPNDYANVRTINSENCHTGYQILGTTNQDRYLHVICEVNGWDMDKSTFKKTYSGAKYVPNKSKVQLYTYPDGERYCNLVGGRISPIDDFCIADIKEILKHSNITLSNDEDHIEETLLEINALVSRRISKAHNAGKGVYPVIYFQELNKIITSIEKRQRQSIRRAKNLFALYWNENFDNDVDNTIINEILNLDDDDFKDLLIDLHPDGKILELENMNNLDNLVDRYSIKFILYNFFKLYKKEKFILDKLQYQTNQDSFRLSLINAPKAAAGEVKDSIMQNIGLRLIRTIFDTDYLINMNIDGRKFFEEHPIHEEGKEKLESGFVGEVKDNIFSSNLEYIDYENTVRKLKENQDSDE